MYLYSLILHAYIPSQLFIAYFHCFFLDDPLNSHVLCFFKKIHYVHLVPVWEHGAPPRIPGGFKEAEAGQLIASPTHYVQDKLTLRARWTLWSQDENNHAHVDTTRQ